MAVETHSIQAICDEVTRDIEQTYNGLSLYFIIHGTGKFRESAALAKHEITTHPAAKAARTILEKSSAAERSGFLGIAIASQSKMLGFSKKDHLLGLLNINQDHFRDEIEIRAQIYHLMWHAVDLYEIRNNPRYARKFKSGPMIPKRSALNLSKANLQADVFAGVLSVLKSEDKNVDESLVKLISKKRGHMSLTPIANYKAEDYPSIVAMDSCELALKEIINDPPTPNQYIACARKLSLDVGQAYDQNSIKQWWDFALPAQDMAWRGFTPEEILGAAGNTSENPFVRSVAYLIQEVTNLEPVHADSLQHRYNAFVDPEVNMTLHYEMVDSIFEIAVNKGEEDESNQALIDAANKQNEELTEGRILGWCANALQDAARAFERALITGASPSQAARMHFEGNKKLPEWSDLKELGHKVIDQRRQGFAVTMGHIAEICHNNLNFAPILDSMKITMNDPSYVQKLEAANDLAIHPGTPAPKMAPQSPAPKGPAPRGPAPNAPTPAGLGLNGPKPPGGFAAGSSAGTNNRKAELLRQRQEMLDKQSEENPKDDKAEE